MLRPRTVRYRDLAELVAALFESLLMNHPFVDSNKRVAPFPTDVFLRRNGWKLEVAPHRARRFLIGLLAAGACNFIRLLPWIHQFAAQLDNHRR